MILHPDVLTDLVILYHAGEASQASRELLEKEALQNPAIAAALAAQPRLMQPIALEPKIAEREVLEKVRRHYLYNALTAIGIIVAFLAMFALVRLLKAGSGIAPQ
jgi:hypothetical protein